MSGVGRPHNDDDDDERDEKNAKSARPHGSVGVTDSDGDDDLASVKLDRSIIESTDELSSSSPKKTDLQLSSSSQQQQQQQSTRARAFCVEDDNRLSLTQLMVCGGLAGITEHVAMYPVDTIKTRMQSYTAIRDVPASWTMAQTTRDIVRREGIWSLWRGMSAVLLSAGPAHAVYFATYERVTNYLGRQSMFSRGKQQTSENNEHTNTTTSNEVHVNPIVTSIAGGCATIVGDGLMTPLDVVKQRMQLRSTSAGTATMTNTSNVWSCISHVYHNHGARAFYAGYKATLLMNIPFTAVYFTGYETAKQMLLRYQRVEDDEFSVSSHCLAGAAAGAAAAAITNPLDVVKTRLQTQGEVGARRYRGLVDALYSIRVEEGTQGLLRGMRARVLFHMPAAAVCWTTYEFCKHVMKRTGWWSGDDDVV